jgi:transposase
MVDVTEILVHWHAGRSFSEIATSLGVDPKTVKKYTAPAVAAGIVPGGVAKPVAEWEALVRHWFPQMADTRLRQTTWPQIEVHRDYIVAMLTAGVTKQTIWQRLCDEQGLEASSASLKRYIAANLPEQGQRARVTVLREDPPPGQEAQIDYGYWGSWTDPVGGARHRIWAFVMVLAFSRMMFVRPVLRMDQHAWTEAHVAAFEFFGGVPARLVCDYVARHIIGLLCPAVFCARPPEILTGAVPVRSDRAHNEMARRHDGFLFLSAERKLSPRWRSIL